MPARATRAHADLDEIAPNTFIIHNDKLRPVLRGEGVTNGHTFQLLSQRRRGLIGRLKMRGFNVRTLESRLERLPKLPPAPPIGETLYREASPRERWSIFDIDYLRWHEIEPADHEGRRQYAVKVGQLVRRRRARTGGDCFQVDRVRPGQANLLPLSETDALMRAYAQATFDSDIEIDVRAEGESYRLSLDFVLPQPYLDMLRCTGEAAGGGLLIGPAGWPMALRTLHRLNLRPSLGDYDIEAEDRAFEAALAADDDNDDDDDWDDAE